jgi:GxxExxY protein
MNCVRRVWRLVSSIMSQSIAVVRSSAHMPRTLLIENQVMVELKAVRALDPIHKAQCLNHLKATGLSPCLLVNFGNPRLEIRREVNDL